MVDSSKEQRLPGSRVLHGGRPNATYTMAETGELKYNSDVAYRTLSPTRDSYESMNIAILKHLTAATKAELDCQVCYALVQVL